jgi:RNA polymerase sigma factor (sigma-70 family)
VQDSFITAMNSAHALKNQDSLFPWLQKIVINNALQHLRKQKIVEDFALIQESISEMEVPDNQLQNKVLLYDFTREEILESIDQLNFHQKSVFNLYYFENLSHQDIANELSINVNTSKSHLLRAKKNVQKFLSEKIESNSKTKRKIGILLFFGLGNWMWAKTLESKFQNFAIQPTKEFQTSDANGIETFKSNTTPKSTTSNAKKAIIVCIFFFICLLPLFYWWFQIENNRNQPLNEKTNAVTEFVKPSTENLVEPINQTGSIINSEKPKEIIEEQNTKKETSETKSKSNHEIKKDTATKKIIVVKKIIQRDTIFVERQQD